jgi:hypothetical protein
VKRALLVAGLGAPPSAGCGSPAAGSVEAVYRDVLRWDGRDDASATRQPSSVQGAFQAGCAAPGTLAPGSAAPLLRRRAALLMDAGERIR